MPDSASRIPPHREESEKAVLAAVLFSDDGSAQLGRLRQVVPMDAFYLEAHRSIWQAICDLVDAGTPVDTTTISHELQAQSAFQKIGGAAYLGSLYDAMPYRMDLDGHVELLLDAMRGRRWSAKNRYAENALYDGEPTSHVSRLVSEAAAELNAPQKSLGRGECLAAVRSRGVTRPTTFGVAGRGMESGKSTDLGHILGSLFPGQIAVVAGPTGAGKTALMLSLATVSAKAGTNTGYIGLEESQEENEVRIGSGLSWVDIWRIQANRYRDGEGERVDAAIAEMRRLPLWIEWLPGGSDSDVASTIRSLIHRNGVSVVFVDYLQAIVSGSKTEYDGIRQSIGSIERAMGRDCCCVLGSQVNREGTKSGSPEAHHMRGSGIIEERARKVIVISKSNRCESEIGDDGRSHLARREVVVAVRKNKGEEGEVHGFVHRMKGIFWPGYAPPPWAPDCEPVTRSMFPLDDSGPVPDDEEAFG